MTPTSRSAWARLRPRRDETALVTNILALLALPLLFFLARGFSDARTYVLEFPILTNQPVTLGLDLDRGGGWEQEDTPVLPLPASRQAQTARFEFPPCRLVALALHVVGPAVVTLGAGEFHCDADDLRGNPRTYATFRPADFVPAEGSPPPVVDSRGLLRIETTPGAEEVIYGLPVARPLVLGFNWGGFLLAAALALAEYVLTAAGVLLLWRRWRDSPPAARWIGAISAAGQAAWGALLAAVRRAPRRAIWAAAAAGVVLSCYPVIFAGKSFVSPNVGTTLLYDHFPTLPSYRDWTVSEPQGSDVLATMVAFVPYAIVQRHALVVDHEFPLYDRYSQSGMPLLAQGQTMIGDPLHVLMLLAGANAWAWDARFLLSRLVFAAGLGLIVRLTTRQIAPALLLAFAGCFLGFFQYRLNHPTYFCLCYAPWILYAWLHLPQVERPREAAPWIGALLLASWLEMNSGPVKDAYLLTLWMNATGVLALLLSDVQPWSRRWRILGLAVWGQVLLIVISNPFWLTALDLILHSWNIYLTPRTWQIQPNLLIGFFDDIFFRQFEKAERAFAPSTNFVVFLGLAFAASYFKALLRHRVFIALGCSAFAAAATAFGVVPPALLKAIPFMGNIMHVDDVFATILIVPVVVLAGFGLAECRRRWHDASWFADLAAACAPPALLVCLFLGTTQASQRALVHALEMNHEVVKSFFFWCDASAVCVAFVAFPLLLRKVWRDQGRTALGLAPWIVLCLTAMLWRQGQHLHFAPALDKFVSRPQARADFYGRSPAVDYIHEHAAAEPGRVLGMQNNLFPGTSGMFGLEGITGPDAMVIPAYHYLLAAQLPFMWEWRILANKGTVQQFKATYDFLNIRYYLAAPGGHDIPLAGVSRVAQLDMDVFESHDAWPRAFFSDVLSPCPQPADFLAQVARDDHPFAVRQDAADLPPEVRNLPSDQTHRAVVPATNYRLTSNTTTFEVRAPSRGVITLLETYNGENKQVTVNGRPAPHFPVDMAFEGIYVDHAGTYTVSVRSWPRYLTAGLYASALGMLLLGGTGAIVYWPLRRASGARQQVGTALQTAPLVSGTPAA